MRRSTSWILVLAILPVLACGGDDDDDGSNADAAASADASVEPDAEPSTVVLIPCTGVTPDAEIGTAGFAFSPNTRTVGVGDTIRFTPTGSHNMTSDTGEFATPTSQVACLHFTATGAFPFFCSVHPSMMGTVTVN